MKVIVNRSFVSRFNGQTYRPSQGDVVEMPEGADWLRAGLVSAVEETVEEPTPSRKKGKGK